MNFKKCSLRQKARGFEIKDIENGKIEFSACTELSNIAPEQVYDFLINMNQESFVKFHPKDHKIYEIRYRPEYGTVGTVVYLKEVYENGYCSSSKARFIEAVPNKKIVLKSVSPWWQPCSLVFILDASDNGTSIIHYMIIGSNIPIIGCLYNKIVKMLFLSKANTDAIFKHVEEEYKNLNRILKRID